VQKSRHFNDEDTVETMHAMPGKDSGLNRREFIRTGALIAGTAFWFSAGLREAIASSIASGLPLLTASNLNQNFAQARTAGTLRSLAGIIKANPIDWLRANYSITETQSAAIRSIPEAHWNEIKKVLTFVETKRGASLAVSIHETSGSTSVGARKCSATIKLSSEAQVGTETLKAEAEARTS
jgi:hypothetical protein